MDVSKSWNFEDLSPLSNLHSMCFCISLVIHERGGGSGRMRRRSLFYSAFTFICLVKVYCQDGFAIKFFAC